MPNFVQYPRGYVRYDGPSFNSPTIVTQSSGEATITTLHNLYLARSVNLNSWEYRKRVISAAARQFGDFRDWCLCQTVYNPAVHGLNFEFIKDTLHYIETGHRQMGITSWFELVLENPPAIANVANERRLEQLKPYERIVTGDDYLNRWLSHENGFDDLVASLYLFFGDTKTTVG